MNGEVKVRESVVSPCHEGYVHINNRRRPLTVVWGSSVKAVASRYIRTSRGFLDMAQIGIYSFRRNQQDVCITVQFACVDET